MVSSAAKSEPVAEAAQPAAAEPLPGSGATLRLPQEWRLTTDCLLELSELNEALSFERSADGALVISPPPGNLSSKRSFSLAVQIHSWSLGAGGEAGSADEGFALPDGAVLVPDASWVSPERLAAIDRDDEGIWPLVPDFVLEVRSRGQRVSQQRGKMQQWMANGVRLGWLIDPYGEAVWVYREGEAEPQRLARPDALSGESVMAGLAVDLARFWR